MTTLPVAPGLTKLFEDSGEKVTEQDGNGHRSLQRKGQSSAATAVVAGSSREPVGMVRHDTQSDDETEPRNAPPWVESAD